MRTSRPDKPNIHRDFAVTTLRMEREKLDRLRAVADRNGRTVSQEVRWVLDRHVEAQEEQPS